jgi:hypothetical protein
LEIDMNMSIYSNLRSRVKTTQNAEEE